MKFDITNELIYAIGGFLLIKKRKQIICLINQYFQYQGVLKRAKEIEDKKIINIMGDVIC